MKPNGDCLRGWQECAAREHRARRSAPGRGRALRHRWEAQLIPAQTSQVPPVVVPRQFLGSCPGRKARSANRPSSTESKRSTRRQSGSYVPSFYFLTAGNLSKGESLSSQASCFDKALSYTTRAPGKEKLRYRLCCRKPRSVEPASRTRD